VRSCGREDDALRPLVIVPTYNERDNVSPLIEALLAIEGVRVLVVDDASPDGTADAAAVTAAATGGRASVLRRTGLRGYGRSYVDGIRMALASDITHICQMDCDFSHDPSQLPRLLDASRTADLVIGSRYVPGGMLRNWPAHRVVLSRLANWYVRSITRLPVRDCTSGFRCWSRALLARLPLDRIVSDGYAFQVEMTWAAREAGARIVEVPITFTERRLGRSKLSSGVIRESVILPWRLAARQRR
jgi:dolichol-phosphate mannosyltransferase